MCGNVEGAVQLPTLRKCAQGVGSDSSAILACVDITLRSWNEFRDAILDFQHRLEAQQTQSSRRMEQPLFRGLGNSNWGLATTLERSLDSGGVNTLLSYYRRVSRCKPAVDSLTDRRFENIPDYPRFEKLLADETSTWLDQVLSKNTAIYQFFIYLRHHGCPSPLLDWTVSPYIAAMFAFDSMDPTASHVVVHAYARDPLQAFGSDAHLFVVGPYIATHPRHYLQQSRYSLCVGALFNAEGVQGRLDYQFLAHDGVLAQSVNQDIVVRILIPTEDRQLALTELDSMNINPYSVFGSEDALVRTVSRREMLLKGN